MCRFPYEGPGENSKSLSGDCLVKAIVCESDAMEVTDDSSSDQKYDLKVDYKLMYSGVPTTA